MYKKKNKRGQQKKENLRFGHVWIISYIPMHLGAVEQHCVHEDPQHTKAVLAGERTSPALTMHALCIRYGTKAETNLKPVSIGRFFPEVFPAKRYEMLEPPP